MTLIVWEFRYFDWKGNPTVASSANEESARLFCYSFGYKYESGDWTEVEIPG